MSFTRHFEGKFAPSRQPPPPTGGAGPGGRGALAPPPTSRAHSPLFLHARSLAPALGGGGGGRAGPEGRGAAAAAAYGGRSVLAARRTHKCRCACPARVRLLDSGATVTDLRVS
jgi:hypothetical protein